MSNECSITGDKLDTNELINLINTEQYDKLEEAWLGIIESNSKDLQALFDIVDLLAKREEKKAGSRFPDNAGTSLPTKRALSRRPGSTQKGIRI